jgi:drug/metabolite transporter (DMT)-like permease
MKKQFRGIISLLLATIIWGSAFVAQSVGMDHIGPFTFQAVRCALAVIGLLPVIYFMDKRAGRSFRKEWANKQLWFGGLLCAVPLFLAANLQQLGIVSTSAGKSAFLTAMYIVIVPILGLFVGRKPSPMVPVSVVLAVIGLYLLSCVGVTQIQLGDILLLLCALMFAVQILFVDRFAASVDALRLNCLQAAFCAVASGMIALLAEEIVLTSLLDCWLPLCYAGFLSMGAAYSLQIIGQKHMEPSAASLIMSLESVFAVLFGWLLLKETMTPWEAIGCALVFAAVILSQINIPNKKKSLG